MLVASRDADREPVVLLVAAALASQLGLEIAQPRVERAAGG
jgi:hypothetical protein